MIRATRTRIVEPGETVEVQVDLVATEAHTNVQGTLTSTTPAREGDRRYGTAYVGPT